MAKFVGKEKYTIDATGQAVGRVATRAALILRGKNKPGFVPYLDMGGVVMVENANKIKFTGRKLEQKEYIHHSGYPGGLKRKKMKDMDIIEIVKQAVWNMLPKNKLRDVMIKRLVVKK